MKKKMSLTRLYENEMRDVKAGVYIIIEDDGHECGCGCYYAGSGGSSTGDNGGANWEDNLHSPFPT
jgi:natural product precursor